MTAVDWRSMERQATSGVYFVSEEKLLLIHALVHMRQQHTSIDFPMTRNCELIKMHGALFLLVVNHVVVLPVYGSLWFLIQDATVFWLMVN
jgi:hypothetical protein